MKIAIIGAGNVGGTLGKRFAENGHEIFYGVPNPKDYENKVLNGTFASNAEAAKDAEIIILAVPFNAVDDALKTCGNVDGKTVVDATNPLGMTPKGLNLTIGFETSGAEKLQTLCPNANIVKCFNQTGAENMANPKSSMMFACGNDKSATDKVVNLATEIGFESMNIGDLSKARLLEPLAMLWIHLAFNSELKRNFAFSIQK